MTATTNYQAGAESNQLVLSYAQEAVFGVLPAMPFTAVRLTSESLKGTKGRNRPAELNTTAEVSAATTTQESASGGISFALSYGTFDDLIAGALNAEGWVDKLVSSVAGDITFIGTTKGSVQNITSTNPTKFSTIPIGSWIRISGCAQPGNNGFRQVTANIGGTMAAGPVADTVADETPTGASAAIAISGFIVNSTVFRSFFLQKDFGGAKFLQYPGSFVSGFTLSGGTGNFLSGDFSFMCSAENKAVVNASTGTVVPAPGGRVHDPVGGFLGVFLDGVAIPAVVDSFSLDVSKTGAAQEFGMGSPAAQGMVMGLLQVTGSLKVYFKDFTLYDRFKSETGGVLSFFTRDPAGRAYAITVLNASLMDPTINAGSQNTPVMATFNIEANPRPAGGTIQITRFF